jgi:tetratricopeptide (TPR) repeat protein
MNGADTRPSRLGLSHPRTLLLLAAAFVSLAAAAAGYLWYRQSSAGDPPPAIDLTGADPEVARAVEAARAAAAQSPRSAAAWGRLGMVLAAHDYRREAEPCLARAEQLDPREPRWPYLRGLALLQGNPEAAIPPLGRAADLCPDGPETPRLQLGEALLALGRLDEAEPLFEHTLRGSPQHPRAHLALARIALARDRPDEALEHLGPAAGHPGTRKAAQLLLAEVQQRRQDAAAADRARALAGRLPDDPPWPDPFVEEMMQLQQGRQARLARADRLLEQDRVPEAVALLRETAGEYPDAAWVWLALGRAYVQRGDVPAAEPAFRRALALEPDLIEGHFYLGVALFGRDDAAGAAASFRRATQLKPDYAVAHYNLGQCLLRIGDRAGAREAFATAVRCKPHYAEAHTNLGKLLKEDGRYPEALAHLREAVRLSPADREAAGLLREVERHLPGAAEP